MRTVSESATFLVTESVNSAFKRGETQVQIFGKENAKLFAKVQLCYLSNQWQMALEKGEEIHVVFLGLSKAYDRVSIPGLLSKLASLGFTDSTMQWFTSFLTNREQRVRVDGCLSLPQAPKSGIPQGTVLGPILFLVYINDLPRSIPNECSIFADDTSLFQTGCDSQLICSRISEDLYRATDWATAWGMQLNAERGNI